MNTYISATTVNMFKTRTLSVLQASMPHLEENHFPGVAAPRNSPGNSYSTVYRDVF